MNNDYRSIAFKKWLDRLQQESWQLELIISAFSIFGLFSAIDSILLKGATAAANQIPEFTVIWAVALICILIFIFNLVLHVLLRGLWIGAIGLRYVSGEIDYEKLNYSKKFTTYLKRKVGSFDRYISRLENYSSILFSITFLLVFYVIGFVIVMSSVTFLMNIIQKLEFIPDDISRIIRITILIIFGFSALIVFIDFIGQGILKKKKWTTIIYFPIYWLFSKLTLSFLYRPIAYNFLDNKLGKRISLLLIPTYLIILYASSFSYQNSNYLLRLESSFENFANNSNYENELIEETDFVDFASIPSKVIETPYLKVFIPFSSAKEDFVYEVNKSLKPESDIRGYGSGFILGFNDSNNDSDDISLKQNITKYLAVINDLYFLKIDSTSYKSDFIIAQNAKQRIGFECYLDLEKLTKGKHFLHINGPERIRTNDSIIFNKKIITIPFWYYNKQHSNTQAFRPDSIPDDQ